jgi:hypothetical protein
MIKTKNWFYDQAKITKNLVSFKKLIFVFLAVLPPSIADNYCSDTFLFNQELSKPSLLLFFV